MTLPRLPSRIRQGLNVESGLNDGICVPIFLIALAVAEAEAGAIGDGAAARLVAEQLGYGIARRRRSRARSRRLVVRHRGAARRRRRRLAPDRPARRGGSRVRDRRADRRLGVHRGVRRRHGLRRPAPRPRGEGRQAARGGRRACSERSRSSSSAPFSSGRRSGMSRPRSSVYALLSLTRRPHAPGRSRAASASGARRSDRRLPRLVRAARARLDRLRGDARGGERPPARGDDPRHRLRRRSVSPCSLHGLTAAPLATRYAGWFEATQGSRRRPRPSRRADDALAALAAAPRPG